MKADFQHITASKNAMRRSLAKRPFAEKVRLLEELSERTLATRKDTSLPLPNEPWPIPDYWQWSTMGDVATVVGGGTPKTDRAEYFGGAVPWITPADLSGYHDKTISRGSRNITEEGLANSGARLLPASTVLFSSRAPIGYVAIAANPVATNQGFKSFILKSHLDSSFVYYYLQRAKPLATALASGTTFLEISGKNAARLPIPVPPLAEQRQIVAEIEKQFTRLEAGVAALRRVQANLKRYRAGVLKAACEGRLVPTEAELARTEGRSYEPADQLLARILTERRQKWSGRGQYKEAAAPNLSNVPPLPEGWGLVSLDQLCLKITDGEHLSPQTEAEGVYLLSAKDVRESGVRFDDPKFVSPEDAANFRKRCDPSCGDVLIVSRGATIGRVCVVQTDEIFCLMGSVILLKPGGLLPGKFLGICLSNQNAKMKLIAASGSTAQQAIYLRDITSFAIALPPAAEQERIVVEVDRHLSVIDQLESVVAANLQRATRLRQSILGRAFSSK